VPPRNRGWFEGREIAVFNLTSLNKVDLLPHVRFDLDRCKRYARQVKPKLHILQLSATRGDGLSTWDQWLREQTLVRVQAESPPG